MSQKMDCKSFHSTRKHLCKVLLLFFFFNIVANALLYYNYISAINNDLGEIKSAFPKLRLTTVHFNGESKVHTPINRKLCAAVYYTLAANRKLRCKINFFSRSPPVATKSVHVVATDRHYIVCRPCSI